ncbi:hypothetical protein FJR11_00125 [Anabaena sp. UHCC 0187]|uniref:hypothetical protein n=1 Tax=Anabaena sp. UHCC 0187 TaxID=2590018 RepID=UPI001446CD97|nr:hypothetical protein [Anabaena sp. UHCC 0187]MTJ11029.1 hypothetical protein [Anabaena sp. UHCC 0187]
MNTESEIKSQQNKEARINHTELYQKIDAGVKFAIANAIERHRRLGESISILRDGKIVTLTADEIPPRDIKQIK